MSTTITSASKTNPSPLCTWRPVIEHLSKKDREIYACVCHTLRIMVLHDPAADLEKMRERRALWVTPPKPLPSSIGPSEHFFDSLKESESLSNTLQDPISKDSHVAKTVRAIFAIERTYPQYIPVYHAMNLNTYIFTLFTSMLHSCVPHSSPAPFFIRFPSPKGPKTIPELYSVYPHNKRYDWNPPVAEELLSCNPHLFQNLEVENGMESAWHFYLKDLNISLPSDKTLFERLSDKYHLFLKEPDIALLAKAKRNLFVLAKEFYKLNLKQKSHDPTKGVIWQFLIPPAVLDHVAYASAPFGKKSRSPSGLSLSQRCLALRKDPSKEKRMQVRLLAQASFVPEHDIRVFVHGCDFFSQEQLVKPEHMNEKDWSVQQDRLRQKNDILSSVKDFFKKKLLAIPKKNTKSTLD